MDFAFKLSNITNEKLKMKKHMYDSMLNEQRRIMYMLQQQHMAVVVPVPAPVPVTSTNKKIPKKGFNVVLSKL